MWDSSPFLPLSLVLCLLKEQAEGEDRIKAVMLMVLRIRSVSRA